MRKHLKNWIALHKVKNRTFQLSFIDVEVYPNLAFTAKGIEHYILNHGQGGPEFELRQGH